MYYNNKKKAKVLGRKGILPPLYLKNERIYSHFFWVKKKKEEKKGEECASEVLFFYKIKHFFERLEGWTGHSTARMASSKTFLRPFWVRAEHSR